ncbi:MAG: hypothetical protein KDI63_16625 [Gammaproteobacteria bacterium]|nr:hypothetical protein [Gammaproteobacteria bacterium]
MSKNVIAWTILSLQALVLSGCSFDYYFKDEDVVFRQRQLFNQLCEDLDRISIKRTVEVDGYLTASKNGTACGLEYNAWDPIVKYGYRYHECTTSSVEENRLPENANVYRFTIEPKSSPLCGQGDKYFYTHSFDKDSELGGFGWISYFINEHQKQTKDRCLVVRKVEKPMSQYMVLRSSTYIDDGQEFTLDEMIKRYYPRDYGRKKGMITKLRDAVIDINNGLVIAQYINYGFAPKNLSNAAGLGVVEECEGGRIRLTPSKILLPLTTN